MPINTTTTSPGRDHESFQAASAYILWMSFSGRSSLMPEPIAPPEDGLMISPLPPRGVHALARHAIEGAGGVLVIAFFCARGVLATIIIVFFWTFASGRPL
jgi:hypothetical protein